MTTEHQPIPVEIDDAILAVLGDNPMLRLLHRCPHCEALILVCHNGWMDAKPTISDDPDVGSVGVIAGMHLMMFGAITDGSRHKIHEHQPEELA